MPAEMETKPGFAIRAKCAGDYTTAGYVLEVDFETEDQAREWLWQVLHEGQGEEQVEGTTNGKWLVLEEGGALRLDAVAVLQIVNATISRPVQFEPPVRRRGRRETEDDGA